MDIRKAVKKDLPAINGIYNQAVHTTTATFDTEDPVMVADLDGKIVAWASLSRFSDRKAYDETSEISIYVGEAHRSQGIGKELLGIILEEGKKAGLHTVIAKIVEENRISIALHQSFGFETVGIMREVGRKFGRLLDVRIMRKIF